MNFYPGSAAHDHDTKLRRTGEAGACPFFLRVFHSPFSVFSVADPLSKNDFNAKVAKVYAKAAKALRVKPSALFALEN